MLSRLAGVFIAGVVAAVTLPPAAARAEAAGGLRKLAVMPLTPKRVPRETVEILDELLMNAIQEHHLFTLIGSADISAMIGLESMKSAVGCDDVGCTAEIGGALGVDYLANGTVGALGDYYVIALRLMNIRTSTVVSRTQAKIDKDENRLFDGIRDAVAQLVGPIIAENASAAAQRARDEAVARSTPRSAPEKAPGPAAKAGVASPGQALAPRAPVAPSSPAPTTADASATPASGSPWSVMRARVWPLVTAGTALAAAGCGGAFVLLANQQSRKAADMTSTAYQQELADLRAAKASYDRYRTLSYVGFGLGAALALATVAGAIGGGGQAPGPTTVTWVPVVSPTFKGASLSLAY